MTQGSTALYDPFGNALAGMPPDNSPGDMDNQWLGGPRRPTEHETGLTPIIEMGTRQYDPDTGRFLSTDPIQGGSANQYDYANQGPINNSDVSGTTIWIGPNQFGCGFNWIGGNQPHKRASSGHYLVGVKGEIHCDNSPGTMYLWLAVYVQVTEHFIFLTYHTWGYLGSREVQWYGRGPKTIKIMNLGVYCFHGRHLYRSRYFAEVDSRWRASWRSGWGGEKWESC